MLRIIDKQTNFFIRDDFTHDTETELALDVDPAQGLYKPKWSGEVGEGEWVEGATQEEIDELTKPQPQEPTEKERLDNLENTILMLLMVGG